MAPSKPKPRIGTCRLCGRTDVVIKRGGRFAVHSFEAGRVRDAADRGGAVLRSRRCAGSEQPAGIAAPKPTPARPPRRTVPPGTETERYKATAVREMLGKGWEVTLEQGVITCRPVGRMYAESTCTYEQLVSISAVCGTRSINLSHREGWGGSEVTPGDPHEFAIVVTL